jgi:hypothetical protein
LRPSGPSAAGCGIDLPAPFGKGRIIYYIILYILNKYIYDIYIYIYYMLFQTFRGLHYLSHLAKSAAAAAGT